MEKRQKLVLIGLVSVSLLLLAAVVASASTQLTIWWPQGEAEREVLLQAIEDFKSVEPDIEIKPKWQPTSDDLQKLKIAFVGGNAPDIVRIDHVYVQSLGYMGMFHDLSRFGADELKDEFITSTWNANRYRDKIFALPFDANTIAFMCNKDLLAETGTAVPTTYDELVEVARKNTRDLDDDGTIDYWGYTIPAEPGASGWLQFQWLTWLWRLGGQVLSDDWKEAVYNSPAGVEALEKIVALINEHKVAPPNVYYEGEFYKGSVALMDMGSWALKGREDKPFGFAVLPVLDKNIGSVSGLGLYSVGIVSSCRHPEEAFKFIRFLTTQPKYQIAWARQTYLLPSLKAAYNDPYFEQEPWPVFLKQLEMAKARPGTPAWPQIAEHMAQAIQSVFLGRQDAKQALDEAVAKSNQALQNVR